MKSRTESFPRRIRIWYGSSGSGHRIAATAIEEGIHDQYPDCDVVIEDVYQWLPWHRRWLYTVGWRFVNGSLWNLYSALWKRSVADLHSAERERLLYRRIFPHVETSLIALESDVIISTHPIGSELGVLAKQHGLVSCVISVVTDYHAHAFTHVAGVDVVCIPDEHIVRMVRSSTEGEGGIQEVVTGIPIRKAFLEARASLHRREPPVIVFSKGGDAFPLSAVKRIARHFENHPWTLRFVNVSGIDAPQVLAQMGIIRVEVYPYWKAFASLLADAAVFVAKPGGLTIAEATSLGVPLVATSPHPGQEENNIQFMKDRGIGIEADSLAEIESAILRLLSDYSFAEQALKIGRPLAAKAIVDVVARLFPRKGKTPVYPWGENFNSDEHESRS